ncbi:MAG: VOC family protein [Spirochaetales bacterium]|nr:VOC family protein [Spirochaetales bacterium]
MNFNIEHLGIMAENPRFLADWYISTLGFSELFQPEGEGMPVFIRDGNGVTLEFFSKPESYVFSGGDLRKNQHLSLSVPDFDRAVAELEKAGVCFNDEPFTIFMGGRVRFFRDPEGNWIHLIYRPEMPW